MTCIEGFLHPATKSEVRRYQPTDSPAKCAVAGAECEQRKFDHDQTSEYQPL